MPAVDATSLADGCRAVTLLELLVALFVIAIVLAFAIPAIQSAREAARRAQCQNNLRQVLLATQAFHNAEGSLPSLYNGTSMSYPLTQWDLFHTHSWQASLLPHLEQAGLRQQIAWDVLATDAVNDAILQTVVPAYVCPAGSDPSSSMGAGRRHGAVTIPYEHLQPGDVFRAARSDYDAMAGIRILPEPLPNGADRNDVQYVRWGIWGWPRFNNGMTAGSKLLQYRAGKFRDVADGLSNTIAVVERGGKPIDLLNGEPKVTQDNPDANYPGRVGWSVSSTFTWSLNGSGVGVNESNSTGIYSLHPGGAKISMADGSVRFLAESTSFDALVDMFSRSDGPSTDL